MRPFVGIVIICDEKQYCIPLSSPKEKHKEMKNTIDFHRVLDEDGRIQGLKEGRKEGLEEGANMLAKLIKLLNPDSKEFDKALNGTSADRKRLYKKYKFID